MTDTPASPLEIHREEDLLLLRDPQAPWLHHMVRDTGCGIEAATFLCLEARDCFGAPQVPSLAEVAARARACAPGQAPGPVLESGPDPKLLDGALGLAQAHQGPEAMALRRCLAERLGGEAFRALRLVALTHRTSLYEQRGDMARVLHALSTGDRVARAQAITATAPHAVRLVRSARWLADVDARRPLLPALGEALGLDGAAARRLSLIDHRLVQWIAAHPEEAERFPAPFTWMGEAALDAAINLPLDRVPREAGGVHAMVQAVDVLRSQHRYSRLSEKMTGEIGRLGVEAWEGPRAERIRRFQTEDALDYLWSTARLLHAAICATAARQSLGDRLDEAWAALQAHADGQGELSPETETVLRLMDAESGHWGYWGYDEEHGDAYAPWAPIERVMEALIEGSSVNSPRPEGRGFRLMLRPRLEHESRHFSLPASAVPAQRAPRAATTVPAAVRLVFCRGRSRGAPVSRPDRGA